MLIELAIEDFAIIERSRIAFGPGFNALTGETGAGKSILIDALGAVLGERVGSDVVRTGARAARVEALFDVADLAGNAGFRAVADDLGVNLGDEQMVLTREINANGRSVARVNGRAANASALARLGRFLVDIHGQSDHVSLLRPAEQLDMLDRFAGTEPLRAEITAGVGTLRALERRVAAIAGQGREREQRIDFLTFQVGEIDAAALVDGEEELLAAERQVLANAERLGQDAELVAVSLTGGADEFGGGDPAPAALPAMRAAIGAMADIAAIDPAAADLSTRLAEILVLLEDLSSDVRDYRDGVEADPGRLAVVEDRLDLIRSLKRKYGATIAEVLAAGEAARVELASLTGSDTDIEALREEAERQRRSLGAVATRLSTRRADAAAQLATAMETTLADLNMGRAHFSIALDQAADAAGVPFGQDQRRVAVDATGADRVTFMLAANAGEVLRPLARVASGGETARLMLALKSILSAVDAIPTLVFDEVDVGVGGRSGQVVGEKLWGIEAGHQVIVITHLPQIAAFADDHFRISKRDTGERIVSEVAPIDASDRLDELAAMLDGVPVTDASRANARTMLDRVAAWKAAHRHASEKVAAGSA